MPTREAARAEGAGRPKRSRAQPRGVPRSGAVGEGRGRCRLARVPRRGRGRRTRRDRWGRSSFRGDPSDLRRRSLETRPPAKDAGADCAIGTPTHDRSDGGLPPRRRFGRAGPRGTSCSADRRRGEGGRAFGSGQGTIRPDGVAKRGRRRRPARAPGRAAASRMRAGGANAGSQGGHHHPRARAEGRAGRAPASGLSVGGASARGRRSGPRSLCAPSVQQGGKAVEESGKPSPGHRAPRSRAVRGSGCIARSGRATARRAPAAGRPGERVGAGRRSAVPLDAPRRPRDGAARGGWRQADRSADRPNADPRADRKRVLAGVDRAGLEPRSVLGGPSARGEGRRRRERPGDHPARRRREAGTPSAPRARTGPGRGVAHASGGVTARPPFGRGRGPRTEGRRGTVTERGRERRGGREAPCPCAEGAGRSRGMPRVGGWSRSGGASAHNLRSALRWATGSRNGDERSLAAWPAWPIRARGEPGRGRIRTRARTAHRPRDDRPARGCSGRRPRSSPGRASPRGPSRRAGSWDRAGPCGRSGRTVVRALFRALLEPPPGTLRGRAGSHRSTSTLARRSGTTSDVRRARSRRSRRQRVPARTTERGRLPDRVRFAAEPAGGRPARPTPRRPRPASRARRSPGDRDSARS